MRHRARCLDRPGRLRHVAPVKSARGMRAALSCSTVSGFLNGCVMPMAEGMKVVYQDAWNPNTMLDLSTRPVVAVHGSSGDTG